MNTGTDSQGYTGTVTRAGNAHGYAVVSTPYPPCKQLLAAAVRGASLVVVPVLVVSIHLRARLR
jgi:hypothetical protein